MNIPIQLSKDSREPIYHQIEQQLKVLIAGGYLPEGTSLPSIRVLSKELEVSVITTRRAYQNLEQSGFIQTIQGKGTFVAKVNEARKQATKKDSVSRAFHEAISLAFQYDYTEKQIQTLVKQMLLQHKGGNQYDHDD